METYRIGTAGTGRGRGRWMLHLPGEDSKAARLGDRLNDGPVSTLGNQVDPPIHLRGVSPTATSDESPGMDERTVEAEPSHNTVLREQDALDLLEAELGGRRLASTQDWDAALEEFGGLNSSVMIQFRNHFGWMPLSLRDVPAAELNELVRMRRERSLKTSPRRARGSSDDREVALPIDINGRRVETQGTE